MSKPDPNLTQVVLKDVRLSFPKLFTPEKSTPDSKPKFSAAFLVDPKSESGKDNLRRVLAAIKSVCEAEWGDPDRYKKLKADRVCVGNGEDQCNQETGEVYDGYEGMKFVKASSPENRRPQTVDRKRRPVVDGDQLFYGGCYVNAVVRVYAVKGQDKGGNGVFASLEAVQFYRDGEAFGAGPVDVDSVFDDLGDDEEDFGDPDNSGKEPDLDMDDDIPF